MLSLHTMYGTRLCYSAILYEDKSIIIRNAVVVVFLLAAFVLLRRLRMCGFIFFISAQV